MAKLTNNRKAARTIFTKAGAVRIAPGETKDVDISADAVKDEVAAGMTAAKAEKPEPAKKSDDNKKS